MLGEESYISKAQNLSGKHGRICGGHKREGKCALPGEVCLKNNRQKSAEAIVLCFFLKKTKEGQNVK